MGKLFPSCNCPVFMTFRLADIYLRYVFDLWENVWRKKCERGEVIVIRGSAACGNPRAGAGD